MKVLTIVPHFLPGFQGGGPIRTVVNLVAQLGSEVDFHIVTSDRDMGDRQPYAGIRRNQWQQVGQAQVVYASSARRAVSFARDFVRQSRPNVLYLNSFFDGRISGRLLLLRQSSAIPPTPLIIAPRGQFDQGAIAIKAWKKLPYLALAKPFGLNRVLWHATSDQEREDIQRVIGREARIVVAPNLCALSTDSAQRAKPKRPGSLRLVFLSRIVPKKNLLGVLESLRRISAEIALDIWGPMEDAAYWRRCQQAIGRLPRNVRVRYCGTVEPSRVAVTLAQYDGMVLMTHGENFGHVIVESLAAGCPILISDRTPWRGLQQLGVGWDISLRDELKVQQALETLVRMDEPAHRAMRARAANYGRGIILNPEHLEQNRLLFHTAVASLPTASNRSAA